MTTHPIAEETLTLACGLRFGLLTCGDPADKLALLLHGFPDTADTWRAFLPRLAEAGYRAVAPHMRGYHPTAIPADGDYSVTALGHDALAILDALGATAPAALIAHDWGASAAYCAANLAPQRFEKMVIMAIPHPRTLKPSPRFAWGARHFMAFQFKNSAVARMRKDDFAYVDEIYRRWSPSWEPPPEETAAIKRAFAQPGVIEAALGYYWAFVRGALSAKGRAQQKLLSQRTAVPTLAFAGATDGALPPSAFEGNESAYTAPFEWHTVPDAGHFLHREAPEFVIDKTLDFLLRPVSRPEK